MSAALLEHFDLLAGSVGGGAKLRELILSLAVRGRLVPQDPSDEPASELLKKIRAEKDRLITEGKIKRDKPLAAIGEEEKPYELPEGWEWARFGEYSQELCTGPFGSMIHKEDYVSGGVPLINPSHMICGRIQPDLDVSLPLERASNFSAYRLSEGDIVLARRGEVGRYALVTSQEDGWLCGTGSFFVKFSAELSRAFLGLIFRSSDVRAHLQGESVGTTMVNLNQKILLEMPVGIPPLAEQSRIVAKVEELMALCDRLEAEQGHAARVQGHWVEAALEQLAESADADEFRRHWQHLAAHFDTLFTTPESIDRLDATLLQLAVRGKLVPQDPNDQPASELLKQIRAEKDRLITEGKIKRDKPLPPISDEEKPYELPEGWEWVRLSALLSKIGAGSTPLGGKEVYTSTGVKFLRSQNVWNEGLRLSDVAFIPPDTHARMSGTVVLPRDILFNITGASIGRCALVSDDFDEANVSQHVTIIRPVLPDVRRFLHLVLISNHVQQTVMDVQVGVSREGLSIGKLGQFLIPLPPLAEQSRIVAQIEKLLALTG